MKISLVDLKAQYKNIKKEIDYAIQSVIDKTDFIMGEEVVNFENSFTQFIGSKYAFGVSSGTDALHLALCALNVTHDDEVILPSFTFTATAEVVVWRGAKPVFVDIDEKTYNIDPVKIEKVVTKKTKGIIPVHLFGQPADMNAISKIAMKHKLWVLEDCAQAHGAQIKMNQWKTVGSIGDISCFSFYPGKNIGAYGDAGMLVTNDSQLAQKVGLLRNHGRKEKYTHLIVGYGNRLDTIQAAILSVKLKYLKDWNIKRVKIAGLYDYYLGKNKNWILPLVVTWAKSVFHLYPIRVKNRDKLREFLKTKGIETGVHYPIPLHLQPAYRFLGYKNGSLPVCENIAKEILSLPIYPELQENQIEYIVKCIKDFFS
ncbi:DegT/DnrJ/EryC1/StrS family aminotransferase [Candidatus Gottesmanbacteria bacterium]|nr:DegT/DnrJ/EryC1/StrS family aminotransferase [Candidatus Gottesmanbacteria bacterium]